MKPYNFQQEGIENTCTTIGFSSILNILYLLGPLGCQIAGNFVIDFSTDINFRPM